MSNKFLIVCGGSGVGLLGQRRVLGIDGEIQVDVREEIEKTKKRTRGDDERSISVKLDIPTGTALVLLNWLRGQISFSIKERESIRHVQFLGDNWLETQSLMDGLAKSPAIGGGTIMHDTNIKELDSALRIMIHNWAQAIGKENPLDVYIVSSTAGGTGEGVHRLVGERLVNLLSSMPSTSIKLNFIRIGPGTYKAVDRDRTALNTFFAVAADAAYKLYMPRKYKRVGVNTNWFYQDLPDVGSGEPKKPIRAKMIDIASKVLMMEELTKSLNLLLANDTMVVVKTGFWGKDFDEKSIYAQTLESLIAKLEELTKPEIYIPKYLLKTPKPNFVAGPALQDIIESVSHKDLILSKLEETRWRFPPYREPSNKEQALEMVSEWLRLINELAGQNILNINPSPQYLTDETINEGGEQKTTSVPLAVTVEISQGTNWLKAVYNAQRARAWSGKLLGDRVDGQWTDGIIKELLTAAKKINYFFNSLGRISSSDEKAKGIAEAMTGFVEKLVQAKMLLIVFDNSERLLDRELKRPKEVLKYASEQHNIHTSHNYGQPLVIAAELDDPLDRLEGRNWLDLIIDATENRDRDPLAFKEEVLRGATGLTFAGLATVLNLESDKATIGDIKRALIEHMGEMIDKDNKKTQAQWWNADPPTGILQTYEYRILPRLDIDTREKLGQGERGVTFVYSELGMIGLNVLAFQGVSIAEQGDSLTTPLYLLSGFVPLVEKHLENWDHKTGETSGKYKIATSGVIGDPLYRDLLVKAGFTQTYINKLSEFFPMYTPGRPYNHSVNGKVKSTKQRRAQGKSTSKASKKTKVKK